MSTIIVSDVLSPTRIISNRFHERIARRCNKACVITTRPTTMIIMYYDHTARPGDLSDFKSKYTQQFRIPSLTIRSFRSNGNDNYRVRLSMPPIINVNFIVPDVTIIIAVPRKLCSETTIIIIIMCFQNLT